MYSSITRTNSMKDSDIDYNYDHLFFNIFIPYTDKLLFNIKMMAGASDINVTDDEFNQIDKFVKKILDARYEGEDAPF